MKISITSYRRIAAFITAACLCGAALTFSATSYAQDSETDTTNQYAQSVPDADSADETVDWQKTIDAADEGSSVTLTGIIAGSLIINKKLTITAAADALVTGSIRINASGTTITGVHFQLDPAQNKNAQNIIVSGKAEKVQITGNTFVIKAGDPATGASQNKDWQPSSVWLEGGATGTVIDGNTFKLGQVVNNSSVGVNIVGKGTTPITNTTISNNTVSAGPISGDGTSGSMMFVVGNGNTAKDAYGITGLTVSGNIVTNDTGLSADKSRVYGVAVTATKGTVITGNDFEGYLAVSYSVWPAQGPNDDLTVSNNQLNSYAGVWMHNYVTEKGLTAKDNVFGEDTKIQINGSNLIAADQNGKVYPNIAAAIDAGATKVTLLQNVTESVVIKANQTLTLDLNGYTLTNTDGQDTISNEGVLTVTDSSLAKSGVVDNTSHGKAAVKNTIGAVATLDGGTFERSKEAGVPGSNGGNSYYTIQNMGSMTINDGVTVLSELTDGSLSQYSSVIANGFYNGIKDNPEEKTAELLINGGTIKGGLYIKNDEYGKLTIKGGDITGSNAAVLNYGTADIAGGTLRAGIANGRVVWNIRIDSSSTSAPGDLTISGGTIDAKDGQTAIWQEEKDSGRITISGGDINGPIASTQSPKPVTNLVISGGVFSERPDASYLADDLKFVQNADGDWVVKDNKPTPSPNPSPSPSPSPTPSCKVTFTDVTKVTPHHKDICWIAEQKITTGYSDGTYRGMTPVYRQDMAAFLYRLAGSPSFNAETAANPFADVNSSTPHYKEILWLYSTGIAKGYVAADGTATFGGMTPVYRQDMAAFLHRLAQYKDAKEPTGIAKTFTDVNEETPHYADILWLSKSGVTAGYVDGTFGGMTPVYRQDMAAFLHRMHDNVLN
ncbi:S-layer homology domain-containing protein [Bifidobacterium miconisargentati]|uniref:S-layer homology domain-containing protein n=1 Tax=Bifidobacterium miconisargentati TaxID=2834437 RepID=UPI001BDBDA10|nr:S-layer homology domain-containing protein [Bifidobacterium miconisargentati]MBW3091308.1 S-layer homology domain-containing protein [Bifidobacterium miconisargentati]